VEWLLSNIGDIIPGISQLMEFFRCGFNHFISVGVRLCRFDRASVRPLQDQNGGVVYRHGRVGGQVASPLPVSSDWRFGSQSHLFSSIAAGFLKLFQLPDQRFQGGALIDVVDIYVPNDPFLIDDEERPFRSAV